MSADEEAIRKLLLLAQSALASVDASADAFTPHLSEYLDALEQWREKFAQIASADSVSEEAKVALRELNETHRDLLTQTEQLRSRLVDEMGAAQKKAKALRTYVDRLPQRITITGHRKG